MGWAYVLMKCRCMRATGSPAEISNHSFELARLVYSRLSSWRHSNGRRLAELYHRDVDFQLSATQGPIVNFNLRRADGTYIRFTQVGIFSWALSAVLAPLPRDWNCPLVRPCCTCLWLSLLVQDCWNAACVCASMLTEEAFVYRYSTDNA